MEAYYSRKRWASFISFIFVNDLILFGEKSSKNATTMKAILEEFCHYSRHKINFAKSEVCFSTNTDISLQRRIGSALGFHQTNDLGSYLGIPLFHTRVKKSTFQFLIEKVQRKLNGYDAKLLSLVGRTTLAKSVLLAILGYFMQAALLPIGVCARIEQIVRQFIWGSNGKTNKTALVNWESFC